jgi:hypothetical protein
MMKLTCRDGGGKPTTSKRVTTQKVAYRRQLIGICFFTAGPERNHSEALPQEKSPSDAVK